MTDKSANRAGHVPKGVAYCDVPGTSCCYDEINVCVNCNRQKGWRQHKKKTDALLAHFSYTSEQIEVARTSLLIRRDQIQEDLRQVEEALEILTDDWYDPII